MRNRFILGMVVGLSACATLHAFDMPKVQDQMARAVQNAEAIMTKAQTDFREKKDLLDNLKKGANPEYAALEPRLEHHLEIMRKALADMTAKRKAMGDANAEIVALAYSRQEVRSDQPEYARVDEASKTFQTAAAALNATVIDYSDASNSIADEVAAHKLFYNFEVADFQKRVQQAIQTAQKNLEQMKRELKSDEDRLNNWGQPDTRAAAEDTFKRMQGVAQDYTDKAQGLAVLSQDMHEVAQGEGHLTTLDPAWPEAKKLVDRLEQLIVELNQTHESFQSDVAGFRAPFK